jgi:hypothetical protein
MAVSTRRATAREAVAVVLVSELVNGGPGQAPGPCRCLLGRASDGRQKHVSRARALSQPCVSQHDLDMRNELNQSIRIYYQRFARGRRRGHVRSIAVRRSSMSVEQRRPSVSGFLQPGQVGALRRRPRPPALDWGGVDDERVLDSHPGSSAPHARAGLHGIVDCDGAVARGVQVGVHGGLQGRRWARTPIIGAFRTSVVRFNRFAGVPVRGNPSETVV